MLPLFPLRVVLFPGGLLPLHIFEPRYQALITDCVEGTRRFGIVPPGEDDAEPTPGAVGSVARIRAMQPLPDGRSHIIVSGEERFILVRLTDSDKPYLIGEIQPLEDVADVQLPTGTEIAALQQLGERYAAAVGALEDSERDVAMSPDPGTLSFQVAGLLEWDFPTKQHFLGLRSATERVTRLLHAVPQMLVGLEARAAVHRRAATNGGGLH
jgi:Lon protease-like protein